jgi:hypothetical protein
MDEARSCEQCGTSFVPVREHARFCSASCRVAWNRWHSNDQAAGECALGWSGAAMREATQRLLLNQVPARQSGYVLISEAVWWVTIVDATLVRYHPDSYDAVLASQPAARQPLIEGTLSGLRFVRNQMGYYTDHAEFFQPADGRDDRRGSGSGPVSAWTWRPLPGPDLTPLPPLRQQWEMTRYRGYQAHLAGRTMAEVFGRAGSFLTLAVDKSASSPDRGSVTGQVDQVGHVRLAGT